MASPGQDRRHHIVYVTHNTEYHCRDRECVAVRDRVTGKWRRQHPAVRGQLLGAVLPTRTVKRRVQVGARLIFAGADTLMTSRVLFAGRPDKSAIPFYSSLSWTGVIDPRSC
jgi:hypothetical protein